MYRHNTGTRQAAEDMERVRELFGDEKLSLLGLSYGTKVMSIYATIYPDNVKYMVLDGNADPNTDIEKNSFDIAKSLHQRITYFISACSEEKCGVKDASTCVMKLKNLIYSHPEKYPSITPNYVMTKILHELYKNTGEAAPVLCGFAKDQDIEGLIQWTNEVFSIAQALANLEEDSNAASKPTHDCDDTPVYGNPDYCMIVKKGTIAQNLIYAQDYSFGAYDEDLFVSTLMELNSKFPGAGTQMPIVAVLQWYSACYHWPSITPVPPSGE